MPARPASGGAASKPAGGGLAGLDDRPVAPPSVTQADFEEALTRIRAGDVAEAVRF